MSVFKAMNAVLNAVAMISPNTGDARNPVVLIVVGIIAVILIGVTVALNIAKKNKK